MISDAFRSALAARTLPLHERVRWFATFLGWQRRSAAEDMPRGVLPSFTAILTSYKRPQNIRPIVRSLLRVPEVARVVVSNNNPHIRLGAWTSALDPRVTLIDQHVRRSPAIRMHLALRDDASRFLFTDDDLFLLPSQYSLLCSELLDDPSVPHGIVGQMYDTWLDRMHYGVQDHAGRLDVVSKVATCTNEHVETYFRLATRVAHPQEFEEDILLSFAGADLPRCHRVGATLRCPTADDPAVCRWKRAGYFETRMKLFMRLLRLRPRYKARRFHG